MKQEVLDRTDATKEAQDRALFDRIATKYAAKDVALSSRIARRQRLLQTLDSLPIESIEGCRLLEVGCGAGYSVGYLPKDVSYYGIDYSDELIAIANQLHAAENVCFEAVNAKEFKPDEAFDIVFMIGVLHHMQDIEEALRHVVKLIRPGGWLVVNEPMRANPFVGLARAWRKKLDGDYSDEQLELRASEVLEWFADVQLDDIYYHGQGVFSTPFAEVPLSPQRITRVVSVAACTVDRYLEAKLGFAVRRFGWNVIVGGRKPQIG